MNRTNKVLLRYNKHFFNEFFEWRRQLIRLQSRMDAGGAMIALSGLESRPFFRFSIDFHFFPVETVACSKPPHRNNCHKALHKNQEHINITRVQS